MPHVEELIKKKIQEHNAEQDKKYEDWIKLLEREMKECKANKNLISDPPTSQAILEKMIKEVKSTEVQLESKIKTELKYYMDHHQDKESRIE